MFFSQDYRPTSVAPTTPARLAGGFPSCRPGRRFRGPYRQSEMTRAEAHYL